MSDKNNDETKADEDPSAVEESYNEQSFEKRRKLLKASLAVPPVLMSLSSNVALGGSGDGSVSTNASIAPAAAADNSGKYDRDRRVRTDRPNG